VRLKPPGGRQGAKAKVPVAWMRVLEQCAHMTIQDELRDGEFRHQS